VCTANFVGFFKSDNSIVTSNPTTLALLVFVNRSYSLFSTWDMRQKLKAVTITAKEQLDILRQRSWIEIWADHTLAELWTKGGRVELRIERRRADW